MEDVPKTQNPPRSMKEIIERLHETPSAEALRELQEFECALDGLWQALASLGAKAALLARGIGATDVDAELKTDALKVAETTEQILGAYGEITRAIRQWGLGERGPSNRPRSALLTPPPPGSGGEAPHES